MKRENYRRSLDWQFSMDDDDENDDDDDDDEDDDDVCVCGGGMCWRETWCSRQREQHVQRLGGEAVVFE